MSMTALHTAARDGNVELVKDILVGKNGQVKVLINSQNAVGQTPLHLAAKWGRLGVIECLIEEGADLEIKDRRGRTAVHEADDSIVQARLLRESTRAQETFELRQERKKGDITEVELQDALQRLSASSEWTFQDFEKRIAENEDLEGIHEHELARIAEYMRVRPQEIKNEIFKLRHKIMRKREKEDEKQRLEAKRLKEVADHEDRRAAEKRREERRAEKELFRVRKCGKCNQEYSNDKNRGGQCVHKGEWANWGEDSKGQKVEWLFYWTCCKSQAYEGPAAGHSCCSRSDPHEESHADITRRVMKQRKKDSMAKTKR